MKNLIRKIELTLKTFLALSILSAGTGVYGDDTEIFYSVNVSKPNLLFVLDVSGSMSTQVDGTNTPATTFSQSIVNSADDRRAWTTNGATINLTGWNHFRFTNVNIPKGAEISKAYIQFEAAADNTGNARYGIWTDANVNPARNSISFQAYRDDNNWEVGSDWNTGDRGEDQRADVKNSLERFFQANFNSWEPNDSIAFYITRINGSRTVAAFDHATRAAPQLVIEYSLIIDAKTRLQVMQESLREVLKQAPDNVKVGLMNYGQASINTEVNNGNAAKYRHHAVSGVAFPVTDINAKARDIIPTASDVYGLPSYPDENITIREYIADVADSWSAASFTPIVDALYEAALYYRGEKMHYGQNLPTLSGAHPTTYAGNVVTTNISNTSGVGRDYASAPKYVTPIESSCQENYIVLMTDGAPTYRYRNNNGSWRVGSGPLASIRNTSNGPQGALASAIANCSSAAGVGVQGNCGAELTHYLASNDNLPDPTGDFPNGQEGDQFIGTYTIGFGIDTGSSTETYLKSLATIDDGNSSTTDDGYFPASSPEQLAAAFRSILAEVSSPKGTLASPGYSVNVKNGLEHEKDIYIPVFDRKNSSRWSGNLKKFKIVDVDGKRLIRGKNGVNATDELGGFTSNAFDYWSNSSTPDGKVVQAGGLANLLTNPDGRNIYSNLSGNSNVVLSDPENQVKLSNIANLTNSVLGLPTGSNIDYRNTIVNFMRGWENGIAISSSATAKPRFHMGDMLHSEPLVVTYNKGSGSNDDGKLQYIFAGTNEGYLHAFDTDTGEEKFAFIPEQLLRTISEPQFLNAGTAVDHAYGMDGALTVDSKGGSDGLVDASAGDQVVVYAGLRRGGSAYYALDVTDMDNPELLWTKSATDYPSMGQSWSIPYIAKVGNSTGDSQEVMIVSGGYDDFEDRDKNDGSGEVNNNPIDAISTTRNDRVGNDILILDADDGSLIWSMPQAMRDRIENSIPGGVRILDTNYNGLVDRMYFADTGGHVWRLDLSERIGDSSATAPVLTELASLGGSGTYPRMFYNEPDVALMKLNGKTVFAVSIGSGFRAHPLDKTIDDKFFVLVDESPYSPLESYSTITENKLAGINISSSGVTQSGSIKDNNKRGWVVHLPEDGEKVLGTALAFDGNITFTTLVPEVLRSGVGIDACAAPVTQSRFYAIDILSGSAGLDLNGDGTVTDADIFTTTSTEILGKPQVVFNAPKIDDIVDEDGEPTGKKSCTHPVDIRTGKKLSQTSGYEACRLESVYWSDPVTKH